MTVMLAVVACGDDDHSRECSSNADCDLAGIPGTCRPSPESVKEWCSFPDTTCPSPPAERWGPLAGDGLAQLCVSVEVLDAGLLDASAADAAPADARTDAQPDGAPGEWGPPSILANVNSAQADLQASLSANGLSLFFSSFRPGEGLGDLYVATRPDTSSPFGAPAPITELSSSQNELGPEISATGLELFFIQAGFVVVSTRASEAATWGAPVMLRADVYGTSPSLSGDGLALYYTQGGPPQVRRTTRPAIGGAWSAPVVVPLPLAFNTVDIAGDELSILLSTPSMLGTPLVMKATRPSTGDAFGPLEAIPALGYDTSNKNARWNQDETEIYLDSDRVGGVGGSDLYVSTLQ